MASQAPRARESRGYTVAAHPNDLPPHVLDEWDPRRAAAVANSKAGEGGGKRMRRYAGFSGANCGQNMPAKHKAKYKEYAAAAGGESRRETTGAREKGTKIARGVCSRDREGRRRIDTDETTRRREEDGGVGGGSKRIFYECFK